MVKHFNPMEGIGNPDDDPVDHRDGPEGADFQVEEVTREGPKAIQVRLADTGDLKWVPKSVIHSDSEVFDMDNGTGQLIVFEWWADKEGWL